MARFFKTTILICIVLLTGCQEGGEAGDLFGQWRMTDTHYISFSGSIVRLYCTNEGEVFGNFQHQGDSLFIQCYSIKGTKADTTLVEKSFSFKPFNNIRVKIAALDNDQLVITKGSQTWSLHKY